MRLQRAVFVAFLCGSLAGCAAQQGVDEAIGQLTHYVSIADPALRAAYRAELDACGMDLACVDRTEARWAPVIEASQRVRQVWCAVKPADCEAQ